MNSYKSTHVHYTSDRFRVFSVGLLLLGFLAQSPLSAAPVQYEWIAAGDGDWSDVANWSPATTRRPGHSGQSTMSDSALISGDLTVSSTQQIVFSGIPTDEAKKGVFDALQLRDGAELITTNAVRITSAEGVTRNVFIGTDSVLMSTRDDTNGLQIGGAGDVAESSVWTIRGEVSSKQIVAYTSSSADSAYNGGFILNVDGGKLTAREMFNWRFAAAGRTDAVGQINIQNNGIVSLGEMLNFTHSSGYFVNFIDGTGVLEFNYGSYTTKSDVQSLIDTAYIRMSESLIGTFEIDETDTGWRVSVNAVPEASTYALMMAMGVLALIGIHKRRK